MRRSAPSRLSWAFGRLLAAAGLAIRGRVVDEAGRPMSDANIVAVGAAGEAAAYPVALTLRPGTRVLARVVAPDGAPAKDAWPGVTAWDGVRMRHMPGQDTSPTATPGEFEMSVPVGSLEITARSAQSSGSATVQASAGKVAAAHIVLKDLPAH
jgi:hypothetical protein